MSIDDALEKARRVLHARREARVPAFDPYVASGYNPNEDQMSRALVHLLNPAGTHQFGTLFLKALVRAVSASDDEDANAVLAAIDRCGRYVTVKRPHYHQDGMIDILVSGKDYFVAIENKKRGGGEVRTLKGIQTTRYWRILTELSQRNGNLPFIAIYLSPEGNTPAEKKFRPLKTADLSSVMLSALKSPPRDATEESIALARAFFLTYNHIN